MLGPMTIRSSVAGQGTAKLGSQPHAQTLQLLKLLLKTLINKVLSYQEGAPP